jgi:hypothetical protein
MDVQRTSGITVRRYTNAVQATDAFGDYQHVNKVGAKLYLEQLVADGVIPAKPN